MVDRYVYDRHIVDLFTDGIRGRNFSYTTKKGSTEQQTIIIAIETITKIRSTIASSWNRLSFIVLDFDDDNDIIILISTTFYFCFRGLVPISTITRWITNTILFVVIETKTNL
jgi:hypothetical protein